MPWYEYIGIVASVCIVLSLVFKTTTYKGTILMRIINGLGALVFIAYSICLVVLVNSGYATLIANSCTLCINLFFLIKEIRDHKKELKKQEEQNNAK